MQTQRRREIWITRGHLAALGTATLFIALLAFFVGIQIGRSPSSGTDLEQAPTLLPDPEREDALEDLLREVEAAQAAAPPLVFPEALEEGTAPETPEEVEDEPVQQTQVKPSEDAQPEPPPPAPVPTPLPTAGWSVQIASYDNASDADARVEKLKKRDLRAYRITALIRGKNWYRVKIGSYPSKEAAALARKQLAAKLGTRDLMITEAP